MQSTSDTFPNSKYRLSRRGRKLNTYDDHRIILALPKDVPERVWAEVIAKEEVELMILDIREEILETALDIGYSNYLEKQTTFFTTHCAAKAWLKLIDWHFYRHDPGEDPSSYPPCNIPNRPESWTPSEMPTPSPKDSWCREHLPILDYTYDEEKPTETVSSIDLQVVEDIPSEYWFPGKINWPEESKESFGASYDVESSSITISSDEALAAESEVLQKVTDYSTEVSDKGSSVTALKTTTPVPLEGSLRGAGDSALKIKLKKGKHRGESLSRSRMNLVPKDDSKSLITYISDCRLRNLRLETQYEITSEKMDSSSREPSKRK